ncbi:uncharacterized protein M6B38_377060 [Iris pallida]|uniref:AB hydrolase-1 domain-containing protein n=1 Tax=Iris pallida TaxID=29817 RepID=A0AAX6GB31_IRIPA|nr:uncharacterized protein M6B38_377060 [Iris pallida]
MTSLLNLPTQPQSLTRMTKLPLPVLATAARAAHTPYKLKQGQSRLFHRLPSGLKLEVISQKKHLPGPDSDPSGDPNPNPPLVFVHGSFHAAWCWAEHWLPFFSGSGHDCYAISLLGQGESDVPTGPAAGTLQTHTRDIADFICKEISLPPVLIGHSFGGLIVQSYISNIKNKYSSHYSSSSGRDDLHPPLAGAVLICSVPPSGNSGLVWRYLLSKPIAAIKVTLSLAAKAFANSLPLCKETFFSSTIDDHLVQRYQTLMRESSKLPLFDLKKLNRSLPVPSISENSVDLLVIGASDDFIVDEEGLHETAKFYSTSPVCIQGVAHDMMLDSSWEKGAEIILSWIRSLK